jgi:hypothetical protein
MGNFSHEMLFYDWMLTPKGPLVPMGDKPILGCVVWSQTIFRYFETFCENAFQNKLRVSANFMILGATVQKLQEFEVFRWTLGRAGMCWNQPTRVDYLRKKWGAAQKKIQKKGAGRPCPGVDPWPVGDCRSPAGPGPTTWGHLDRVGLVLFFWIFFLCFFLHFGQFFIGSLGNGLGLLGEWVHSTPIFSSFSLHLEVSNLPFLIKFGDFIFFEILFFLNLE